MPQPDPEAYLQSIMVDNKAKGIFAQANFEQFMFSSPETKNKYMDGCWVFSPKGKGSDNRMCFFVHGSICEPAKTAAISDNLQGNRTFQALAGSLTRAGFGAFYVIPTVLEDNGIVSDWELLRYKNEKMEKIDPKKFFAAWPGRGGRASHGKGDWSRPTLERFRSLPQEPKTKTLLNQQFYNEFVKREFHKPLDDPYDTDCFIVSYGGKVFPVEVKEKFPYEMQKQKVFGIDAGRVLMMLRICLPSGGNAFYIIREVGDPDRHFVKWKHITLDRIIMNCGWNLQAGGPGMGGGNTQTIPIPYKYFEDTTKATFEETNLEAKAELSKVVQEQAKKMLQDTSSFCDSTIRQ